MVFDQYHERHAWHQPIIDIGQSAVVIAFEQFLLIYDMTGNALERSGTWHVGCEARRKRWMASNDVNRLCRTLRSGPCPVASTVSPVRLVRYSIWTNR